MNALLDKGWQKFASDPAVLEWLKSAVPVALKARHDPTFVRDWLDCEGTWFVGVDALNADERGAVEGSGPLKGTALEFLRSYLGGALLPFDKGQVSIVYPGYPRPRMGESDAGFRYRQNRDAAHVDGLKPVGKARRRMVKEPHAFVLGLPMTVCNDRAASLVIWEGSHKIMQRVFRTALKAHPVETWMDVDLTNVYQTARREVFETCPRVKVTAQPGEAYLLHRHALHGVSSWEEGAEAPDEGRMICYFRPEFTGGVKEWLDAP